MRYIANIAVLALAVTLVFACTATVEKATASLSALAADTAETDARIEQEIIKLENEANDILMKRDVTRFAQMLADDAFGTDFSGKVADKAGMINQFKNDPIQWDSITNSEYKVRIYGNVVVVTFLTTGSGKTNGQAIKGQARFTETWVKQKGKWKLAVSQGTIVEGSVVNSKP